MGPRAFTRAAPAAFDSRAPSTGSPLRTYTARKVPAKASPAPVGSTSSVGISEISVTVPPWCRRAPCLPRVSHATAPPLDKEAASVPQGSSSPSLASTSEATFSRHSVMPNIPPTCSLPRVAQPRTLAPFGQLYVARQVAGLVGIDPVVQRPVVGQELQQRQVEQSEGVLGDPVAQRNLLGDPGEIPSVPGGECQYVRRLLRQLGQDLAFVRSTAQRAEADHK